MKSARGFSLIELMVVVAIIAIIVGIGYPSYLGYTQKTRRSDGIAALNHAAMVMAVKTGLPINRRKAITPSPSHPVPFPHQLIH
jgi:prepilin-type N-terminal cleavage/methylation domain-containing protein